MPDDLRTTDLRKSFASLSPGTIRSFTGQPSSPNPLPADVPFSVEPVPTAVPQPSPSQDEAPAQGAGASSGNSGDQPGTD